MELLIVIAIIAILSAALVVGINPAGRFKQARNATRWQHMETISTAVYSYAIEHGGSYPRTSSEDYVCIGDPDGDPVTIRVCLNASGDVIENCTIDGEPVNTWCYGEDLIVPEYLRIPPEDPMEFEHYQIQFVDDDEDAIRITSTAEETWLLDESGDFAGYDIYLIK